MTVIFLAYYEPGVLRTQTALIHDGIFLLAETLKQLGADQIEPERIECSEEEAVWDMGDTISNFMRNVSEF